MTLVSSDAPVREPVDRVPTPAVTVVVATFNRLDSLMWLLDDLGAQAGVRGGFDVVIVDDGSTLAVETDVMARPRPFAVRVIRQDNAGPSVARDVGIRTSNAEIIVIVDDDMVVAPDFVAAHQRDHENGVAVVLGLIRAPRSPQDAPSVSLFERFHQDSLDRFVAAYRSGRAVVDGTRLCTGNVSFLRQAYVDVGGFDRSLIRCEDRDLGIRFEAAGYGFSFTEEGWSDHRSDHVDVATWRRRSALYGSLDLTISAKHPGRPQVSPWAFLPRLPLIARPVVVVSAMMPAIGRQIAAVAYRVGQLIERREPRLAIVGASLCYGCDYYSGVGDAISVSSGAGPDRALTGVRRIRRVAGALVAHRRETRAIHGQGVSASDQRPPETSTASGAAVTHT